MPFRVIPFKNHTYIGDVSIENEWSPEYGANFSPWSHQLQGGSVVLLVYCLLNVESLKYLEEVYEKLPRPSEYRDSYVEAGCHSKIVRGT